jgi:hypothetical protein
MAWAPPSKPGDRDPSITAAKRKLRSYSYGKWLDDTLEYTVEFGVALIQFQTNRNLQILKGQVTMPGMNTLGILDWATKKNLGILPEQLQPAPRPVVFTVNGHLGGLFDGPAYLTARVLEEQGKVRVQPVGYDNVRMPFNNTSGVNELNRLVNALPSGTPFAVCAHSQGSIVFCDWWEQNKDRPGFKGGINFGNPRRPMNVVAPWVADPPPKGSEGLDPDCLDAPIPNVAEVSRDGDLYANKTPSQAAEYKEAVYLAVARGQLMGHNSLMEQMGEIATAFANPVEVFALFQAIVSGVVGLIQLREHGEFDLRPCVDYTARILGV